MGSLTFGNIELKCIMQGVGIWKGKYHLIKAQPGIVNWAFKRKESARTFGNGKQAFFLHWKGTKGYSQALVSIGKEMKATERD